MTPEPGAGDSPIAVVRAGAADLDTVSQVIALWLPVHPGATHEPGHYAARLAAATGRWVDRFRAFDATLERHHPADVPHEYLAILAVRPDRQRRGLGTALLRDRHAQLDLGAGIPAYLEAATWRNVRLYERHGYALTPAAPFHLPGGGPPMWPMTRPATTPARQPRAAPRQEREAAGP